MISAKRTVFSFYLYNNKSRDFIQLENGSAIGRADGQIQFPSDDLISKRHCCFWIAGNEIYIEDMGSTNKTKVNSVTITPLKKRRIRLNDVIEIGNQRLIVTHQNKDVPGYTQDAPKKPKKTYRAVPKTDGSLTSYITSFITKKTLVDVNWSKFQQLKIKHQLKDQLKPKTGPRPRQKPRNGHISLFLSLLVLCALGLGCLHLTGNTPESVLKLLQNQATEFSARSPAGTTSRAR